MEHLVESDAQEDHIELRQRERQTKRAGRVRETDFQLVSSLSWCIFKSLLFVARSWNPAGRMDSDSCFAKQSAKSCRPLLWRNGNADLRGLSFPTSLSTPILLTQIGSKGLMPDDIVRSYWMTQSHKPSIIFDISHLEGHHPAP